MEPGDKVVKFCSSLRHSKGKWARKKFILEPWQEDLLRSIFGDLTPDGLRKVRTAFVFVPRKNGKSFISAAIALYCLVCDGEQGAEIYSAAADREQASLVFNAAVEMIRQSPTLSRILKIRESRKTIYYPERHSFYRAISADAHTKHGFNASVVIYDELHAAPNRELWDVLNTSMAARQQPLTIAITTAGFDRHSICYEIYDYAKKVKDGIVSDPTFLPVIFEADPDDDFEAEETWRKANPNFGVSVNPQYFEEQLKKIRETPSYLDTFLRLHLNIWTQAESRWLDADKWKACYHDAFDPETLRGQNCYAGLDLASTSDLCALVMVFPQTDGTYIALPEFWCPADNAKQREMRDRVPYLTWSRAKKIHLTEGDIVDYGAIRARMNVLKSIYRIKEVAVDMLYQGVQTAQQLQSDGFEVYGFGQGYRSMAAPTLEIEKLVMGGKLIHNSPVLHWHGGNVIVTPDAAGNLKMDKSKSREKIDGAVALAMGLGRAMVHKPSPTLRGLLLI